MVILQLGLKYNTVAIRSNLAALKLLLIPMINDFEIEKTKK